MRHVLWESVSSINIRIPCEVHHSIYSRKAFYLLSAVREDPQQRRAGIRLDGAEPPGHGPPPDGLPNGLETSPDGVSS